MTDDRATTSIEDRTAVKDTLGAHFRQFFDERAQSNLAAYTDGRKEPYQAYVYQERLRHVLRMYSQLGLDKGAAVLDAGCGANPLIYAVANEGYSSTGFDQSLEMLHRSGEIHGTTPRCDGASKVSLCQASLTDFPFRSGSFDVVFCLGVLPYLSTDERALSEINRVLKLGGRAIVSIPQKYNLPAFLDVPGLIRGRLRRLRKNKAHKQASSTSTEPEARFFSMGSFKKSTQQAGFRLEAVHGMRYGPLHLFGRRFLPSSADIAISKILDSISFLPGVGQLGLWQIVQLEKRGHGE